MHFGPKSMTIMIVWYQRGTAVHGYVENLNVPNPQLMRYLLSEQQERKQKRSWLSKCYAILSAGAPITLAVCVALQSAASSDSSGLACVVLFFIGIFSFAICFFNTPVLLVRGFLWTLRDMKKMQVDGANRKLQLLQEGKCISECNSLLVENIAVVLEYVAFVGIGVAIVLGLLEMALMLVVLPCTTSHGGFS
jgi:hypothetical protein